MKIRTALASVVLFGFVLVPAALAEVWESYSNPEKMGQGRYEYRMDQLPLEGSLSAEKLPWPETYFPTWKGGIAYRWQLKKPSSTWSYDLKSLAELREMSAEKIALLSPAEKYDIWVGNYDYPTVRRERARTSPNAEKWTGLCHGWAPAAHLHREPQPRTMINPDGLEVRFGSSDVKALLTFYYGKVNWQPIGWTGSRCDRGLFRRTPGCDGVNAATTHLILTNQLGRLQESFIMDRDSGEEIWNQPYFAYRSTVRGSCDVGSSARRAGATRAVHVETVARYTTELMKSQWEPYLVADAVTGLVSTKELKSVFSYCLELREDSTIVGGSWISKSRPGYIWNHAVTDFADPYWGRVKELL